MELVEWVAKNAAFSMGEDMNVHKNDQDAKVLRAGLLLIGNELLSGKTQDCNLQEIALRLGERGVDLVEARVIQDDVLEIVAQIRDLKAKVDFLFLTGGIGPTHDDVTAEAVALAFERPLTFHAEADRRLEAFFLSRNQPYTQVRRRMARTPEGAYID